MDFSQEMKDLQSRGIDSVTGIILNLCSLKDSVRPSDIALVLEVNPSSITRRIQTLEKEGLIKLTKDSKDQRSVRIQITDKGRETYNYLIDTTTNLFEKIFSDWSLEEIHTFTNQMNKFISTMKTWRSDNPITDKNIHRQKLKQTWKDQK